MATIKVTVRNEYMPRIIEEFTCFNVDISDLLEVGYCAEECCGEYLDRHNDIIRTLDVDFETLAEACSYTIEEDPEYDA